MILNADGADVLEVQAGIQRNKLRKWPTHTVGLISTTNIVISIRMKMLFQ